MSDFVIESAQGSIKRVVAVRLQPKTDVYLGLVETCKKYGINNGVILSAIGSISDLHYCTVDILPNSKAGYGYNADLTLTGPLSLTSAAGIICHDDDGETNLHVHVTVADKYGNMHGGHLREGTEVLLTFDAVLAELDGVDMKRKFNEDLGVPIFAPEQK